PDQTRSRFEAAMDVKVLWAMTADQFIVDQAGKFSVIGVWENLAALAFPAVHPLMFVVSAWEGDANSSVLAETRIWTPQQALLVSTGAMPLRFGANKRALSVNQLVQTQFVTPGAYRIEFLAEGRTLHYTDIQLTSANPAPQMGPINV